ncbi:hypothetical protein FBU59_000647 [Linderina macrospora]|uniref:Uncharacterized protein n=1 Tax=Linderina macrospora TaxID=4868 RepID=A0ACC1JGG9_9FUNG|nr:hypothetical protein FBU59_000647 [Linderina macrospora]
MTCNNCNDVPIRGARYKCAQCADFDLCEACEAHDVHRHHVLLKIAVPVPSLMNPRTPLVRRFYPGELEPRELSRTVSEQLEATTHLHSVDLASLYCEFCVLASIAENGTEVVTRDTFFKCLGQFGSSRSVLAARLFAFFDADGDGVLTFPELARSFSVYNKGTLAEKTPHVFRAYDVDGDGKISRDDLRIMLEAFADTNRDLTHNMVHTMEDDILEDPAKLLPGQPVSAAFTAPIPADSPSALDKEVTALRAEVMAMRESSAARRVAMLPVRTREPSESGHTAEMRNTSRSSSRASARIDAGREPDDHNGSSSSSVSFAATTSATIGTVASLNTPRPLVHPTTQTIVPSPASTNAAQQPAQSESSVSHTRSQVREPSQGIMARSTASLNASMDALDEEYDMPVMEALSQDAIRLMIDDIFAEATPADPTCLEYDEFCSYLQRNAGLAIYLEVLGSIF